MPAGLRDKIECLLATSFVDVSDYDRGTLAGKQPRRRSADARTCACDQSNFVFKAMRNLRSLLGAMQFSVQSGRSQTILKPPRSLQPDGSNLNRWAQRAAAAP